MSLSKLLEEMRKSTIEVSIPLMESSISIQTPSLHTCKLVIPKYNVQNKKVPLTTSASHSGGRLKISCPSAGINDYVSVIYTGDTVPSNRRNMYIIEPELVEMQRASFNKTPNYKIQQLLDFIRDKLYPLICFQYEEGLPSMKNNSSELASRLETDYCTDCVGLTLFDVLFPVSDGLVTLNTRNTVSGVQFKTLLHNPKPQKIKLVLSYSEFSGISMACPGGLYEIDHSDKYIYIIDTDQTDVVTMDAVIIDKDDEENHYRLTHGYDFNPNPV